MTKALATHGAYAVLVLMAIDAALPLGGELIMLYGGVLAAGVVAAHVSIFGSAVGSGLPTYAAVVAAGTLGSLAGGLAAYGIGAAGGLAASNGRGRGRDGSVRRASAWVERNGAVAVFAGRLTPVVRSVVSYPAGALRLPLAPYAVATLLASLVWCLAFAGLGWALGNAWQTFHRDFRFADFAVIGLVAAALTVAVVRRLRTAGEGR